MGSFTVKRKGGRVILPPFFADKFKDDFEVLINARTKSIPKCSMINICDHNI